MRNDITTRRSDCEVNSFDTERFLAALDARQTELRLDIKRTEQRLVDLQAELEHGQTAIDNIERDRLLNNEIY